MCLFRKLKADGKWHEPPAAKCAHAETFNDNFQLDLFDALNSEGKNNILGPFHLESNGKNYPNFQMKIMRYVFREDQKEPHIKQELGYWTAGFGEGSLISEASGKVLEWKSHEALTVFRIVTVVVSRILNNLSSNHYEKSQKSIISL